MKPALSPKTAHIILFVFDLLALAGLMWVYSYIQSIYQAIGSNETTIVFESGSAYVLLGLIMPILHLFSILSRFKSPLIKCISRIQLPLFACCAIALLSAKYLIQYRVELELSAKNYQACSHFQKGRYHSEIFQKNACDN